MSAEAEQDARLFKHLLESIADPVTIVGRRGETLVQNAASKAALPAPPPQSLEDWDKGFVLHTPDGVRRLSIDEWPVARALKGERVVGYETSVLMPNDPTQPIRLLADAFPILGEAGAVEGAILISHDVTAQRRIEAELASAHRMEAIGELTGGVAHDFNNILTAIISLAESLRRDLESDARLADKAARIDAAAGRGAELVQHLLAFARKQPLKPSLVDVNATVTELLSLLRSTLGKNVRIEAELAGDLPMTLVDATQLAAALLNMAVNARDAMPEGGVLTLRTNLIARAGMPGGKALLIDVADTGCGIPFDQQGKVFEPFYTTKGAGKGTGLGLARVYGFVRQSGGAIELRSAPGRGATFSLYLPVADKVAAVASGAATEIAETEKRLRLLLVEDDAMVRHALCFSLGDYGFEITEAANGPEALALFADGLDVDLMLTDLTMPGGVDGNQLAERVADMRPRVKILISSGHPVERRDNRFTVLRKPMRTEALVRALRDAAAKT